MQESPYWKAFENTGKIEDYLAYKAGVKLRNEEATQKNELSRDMRNDKKERDTCRITLQ